MTVNTWCLSEQTPGFLYLYVDEMYLYNVCAIFNSLMTTNTHLPTPQPTPLPL